MSIKEKMNFDKSKIALNRFFIYINEKFNKVNNKAKLSIGGVTLALVLLFIVLAVNNSNGIYSLSVDGKDLGYVDSTKQVGNIISQEKDKILTEFPKESVIFDQKRVSMLKVDLAEEDVKFLSDDEIALIFSDRKLYSKNAWVIKVDGKSVVSANSKEDANLIIEGIKSNYKSKDSELLSASFKQKVEIANELSTVDLIMKVEDAKEYILTGTKEAKTYTVKSGDTMWDIAASVNMSPYELQAANPGFEPDKLKIGQVLYMYEKKPFVNILTVEKIAETKDIPFTTIYENSKTLYKGDIKVKTEGIYGKEKVVAEITKENGAWVATKVISTQTVSEPKAEIAFKGTKLLSSFVGSGYFISPIGSAGSISSYFGASRGGGSRSHTGIDIAAPKGTPIKAADAGIVISAGSAGSYGKLIKISHGKGVITWYGHCNTINVKIGQKVDKGETIGTVGISGTATGYHLHFEIRNNGSPANPVRYI
jgi:murein DD-endopeptidase MepM/ murein hydrolase activator NlpD